MTRVKSKVQQEIEACRKLLEATPVDSDSSCPAWLERAVRETYIDAEILAEIGSDPVVVLQMEVETDDHGLIFDHYGTTTLYDKECFVLEPYAEQLTSRRLRRLERIAEDLGCDFYVSANSWHYPGRTVRLVFEPKSE